MNPYELPVVGSAELVAICLVALGVWLHLIVVIFFLRKIYSRWGFTEQEVREAFGRNDGWSEFRRRLHASHRSRV